MDKLKELLDKYINEGLKKIVISNARRKDGASKLQVRPILVKGELVYRYLDETNKEQSLKLKQGDLLSVDKDIHTFENQTDEVVEFIVFRYLPSYKNQSEMIKNDKEIIEK